MLIGPSTYGTIAFFLSKDLPAISTGMYVVPSTTIFFTVFFVIGTTCKSLILRIGVITFGFLAGTTTLLKYARCFTGTALSGI